jgi:manganese transport protein
VILSLQLGFAVIPLIHFVSDKKTMGSFAIKPIVKLLAWMVASILVYLNVKLVTETSIEYFASSGNVGVKLLIIVAGLAFAALLIYSIIFPIITKKKLSSIQMHPESGQLQNIPVPIYKKIAVALDFSENDAKLVAAAIGQARKDTEFILIHIVESASAILHGKETDDYETHKDKERLDFFAVQLRDQGFEVTGILGFRQRAREIVRIVKEEQADMLVAGAHGHTGLKDLLYGTTIDAVRHELKIPVLVITL